MTALSSRERVRRALRHEETDRVPVDFGATRVSGIAALAYRRLLEAIGLQEDVRIYDIKQQLAEPSLAVLDRLGADVVQVQRLAPTTGMAFMAIDRWKPGRMTDGAPALVPEAYDPVFQPDGTLELHRDGQLFARRAPQALYFDVVRAPLADAQTPADIDAYVWPDPWTDREEAYLRARIAEVRDGTDKAILGGLPLLNCSFFESGYVFFGYETFMENLLVNRDLIERWLDRLLEHDLEILERYLAIAGPHLDVIQMNDDYGAQEAMQISPALYREVFKPRQRAWIEFVRARTNARIFIHCDGAVEEILPDFVEIGIEVLNPVQTSARGMDPAALKRKYGKNLTFWGAGVDTQSTLPFGRLDDIRREVRERVELLRPGGGFVFATIHNIQADIPPEKILAVFDTVRACGA